VDAAIARLGAYQWLAFTSSNGVESFLGRLLSTGRDLRALGGIKLAAIGPATAEALAGYHLTADVVPGSFNSEGLVEALREQVRGQRVLLARADRGIELLREELGRVADVEQVAVYSQRDAAIDPGQEERHPGVAALNAGRVDYVTLTSSNIARGLLAALTEAGRRAVEAGRVRLVTISPRTSAAVRESGLPVAAEARRYTTEGVVEALLGLAQVAEGVEGQVADHA
jgi:uroporphyrinogen III methyltransferase/synthase